MNFGKKIRVVTAVFVLAMTPMAAGRIIFVDDDADGANNGSSWEDAYNYLQDALAVASSGDDIRVAQGIYKADQGAGITPSDRNATFQLINGVTIKGGYAGYGEPDANARDIKLYETILSGDLNGDDGPDFANNGENSYHVVTGGWFQAETVLDGFTITAGNGGRGGGIYEASGEISNCKITANSATAGGGLSGCRAVMTNCIISHNRAIGSGGWSSGGGMFNDGTSPTLLNCIFVGNSALGDGGGMFSLDNFPTLVNCTFTGNSAGGEGGGMLSTECWGTLFNCTFSGNTAGEKGGGITNHHDCELTVYNCILWGNTDSGGTDESAQFYAYADRQNIDYSCLQGWTGSLGGTGNIGDDPLFVDADGPDNVPGTEDDNLRLQPDSPCTDAGGPNYIPYIPGYTETDLDGNPRVIGGRIDMGAYEFQPPRTLYVDDNAPNDPGPGDPTVSDPLEDGTQAHPFDAIQKAIDMSRHADTIIVTEGTYVENIYFKGKNIILRSTSPNNPEIVAATIIDGNQAGCVVTFAGTEDETCVLAGFTLCNGNGDQGGGICGGTWEVATHTTIHNNRIVANTVGHGGAVAYCDGLIQNNTVSTTSIWCEGGAIYDCQGTIQNNTIIDNANIPALIRCDGLIQNNVIADNSTALQDCDGIIQNNIITGNSRGLGNCNGLIQNNIISHNRSGIYRGDEAIIRNNIITGNSYGGLIYCHGQIRNNLISGNSSSLGGAFNMCGGIIENNTIAQNSASRGGAFYCSGGTIRNCIIWGNTATEGPQFYKSSQPTYSCIQDWAEGGEGNIATDPCFASIGYRDTNGIWVDGDYHLLPDSPCIDAGAPDYIAEPNETDLDGNPRVMGGRIDMGAYEAPIPAEVRIIPRTINLTSKGNWLTCYIWLPEEHSVTDMEPNSISLEDEIKPEQFSVDEEQQVAMVRFSRTEVQAILKIGRINLTVSGLLSDGTVFEGTDVTIVIDKGSRN